MIIVIRGLLSYRLLIIVVLLVTIVVLGLLGGEILGVARLTWGILVVLLGLVGHPRRLIVLLLRSDLLRRLVFLVQDSEPVQVAVFHATLVQQLSRFVAFCVDGRESLELLIRLLVEVETLEHVVSDYFVKDLMLVFH